MTSFRNRPLKLCFLAPIALAGCLFGGDEDGATGPDPIPGDIAASTPYSLRGEWLHRSFVTHIRPTCSGSQLDYDTLPQGEDSLAFSLAGDKLELAFAPDSSEFNGTMQRYLDLARVGSGKGLIGTWRWGDAGYRVLSGDIPPQLKARLDSNLAIDNAIQSLHLIHFRITRDSLTLFIDANTSALEWIYWTNQYHENPAPDSANRDMDFRIVDRHTVEFHGRKTGEKVRLTRSSLGDYTYVSDNPAHPTHRHLAEPTSCPNEWEPDWYPEFQRMNSKEPGTGMPKASAARRAARSLAPFPSLAPFGGTP